MSRSTEQRPVLLGEYMVRNSATVRAAAKHFGISKSTVHKDIRTRLPQLDSNLFRRVEKLLELNKQERHIRGGLATRRKYQRQKEGMKENNEQ
jgi:putative DeoR family transcriptional regulator (stage III sporulation protein D)